MPSHPPKPTQQYQEKLRPGVLFVADTVIDSSQQVIQGRN